MQHPNPDELLRRLRAIYCRHKCLTYEEYDRLVAEERITFAELTELVEVLFTEVQHVGLYEFLFKEEAERTQADKARLAEIRATLQKIGSFDALRDRYAGIVEKLTQEAREIQARLGEGRK